MDYKEAIKKLSKLKKLLEKRRASRRNIHKDEVSPRAPFSPTKAITIANKKADRRKF